MKHLDKTMIKKAEELNTYLVLFDVVTTSSVRVQAVDMDEAIDVAYEELENSDFGDLEYVDASVDRVLTV